MAYDEGLTQWVRATRAEQPAVVEKKMFGVSPWLTDKTHLTAKVAKKIQA